MKILLVAASFFLVTPSADAAPVCPIAKLYTGSSCALCTQITTSGKESIATLTGAGRLEVTLVDTTSTSSEKIEFSDLQVFDKDTKQMLALYQDDAPSILAALDELAKQKECNALSVANARSLPNQLSARGIPSDIFTNITDALLGFFRFIGSIFMSLVISVVNL